MTNAERTHLGRLAEMCCILCRHYGIDDSPAEIHHIRTGVGAGKRSSHFDALPLCPIHHRLGNEAIHVMGRKAFERHHGITELELLAEVKRLLSGFS